MAVPVKRPRGRPAIYGADQAQAVLDLMAKGWPLSKVCALPGMPEREHVLAWRDGHRKSPLAQFDNKYAQARQDQHDSWADEILSLSDESRNLDMAGVQSHKLSVDSRKWLLSKLRPELYGEKLAISGNSGATVNVYLPAKGASNDGGRVIDGQATVVEELLEG